MSKSFDEMSQRERAVAVAEDVIKTIRAENNIQIRKGSYFGGRFKLDVVDENAELQHLLPEIERQGCSVCARGAAFLSHVRLFDNFKASRVLGRTDDHDFNYDAGCGWHTTENTLQDTFSEQTRNLIECAFEMSRNHRYGVSLELAQGAVEFGVRFPKDDERLVAIMENVIANDGEFTVEPVEVVDYYQEDFEDDDDFVDDDDDDDDFEDDFDDDDDDDFEEDFDDDEDDE